MYEDTGTRSVQKVRRAGAHFIAEESASRGLFLRGVLVAFRCPLKTLLDAERRLAIAYFSYFRRDLVLAGQSSAGSGPVSEMVKAVDATARGDFKHRFIPE